ncbi:hypothetical protein [Gallibacterium anatis]|uniref:hypothetical protein n=1 Tax=Gallibacterium anatis TaxID=750 RepID=UPI0038B3E0AF
MKDKDYEKWANTKIEKAIASYQKNKKGYTLEQSKHMAMLAIAKAFKELHQTSSHT